MLGKRLVDYSDSEEENTAGQQKVASGPDKAQPQDSSHKAQERKPVKYIPYSRVSSNNALKNLLSATGSSAGGDNFKSELEDIKKNTRKIEFETVSGKREFEIDAPREKMWKGKKEREAYYYTAMKEIYKDKLAEAGTQEEETIQPAAVYSMAEINGKTEQVKDVSHKDLVNFDYDKYLEQKQRKELLLEDKVKLLKGNTLPGNHHKLTTRAHELLEKEATMQANGTEREDGFKRNKKQYGF